MPAEIRTTVEPLVEQQAPVSVKVPVTVLIAARNEELNLAACLASVEPADQVIVVDSQSTDRTEPIAREFGAEVLQFHLQGRWPKKRNWALEQEVVRNDWVLVLDADERVTPELWKEIAAAVHQQQFDGFYLKWQFIFLGRWMKHCWSHGWMIRLFRRGKGAYEDLGMRNEGGWDAEVHENIVVDGRCGRLTTPLVHDTNQDLAYWIRKQNEFSTWNAVRRLQQLQESWPPLRYLLSGDPLKMRKYLKAVFIRMPFRPSFLFFYLYVLKGGFLDGREGYYFCRLRAIHEFNIAAKIFEKLHCTHDTRNAASE